MGESYLMKTVELSRGIDKKTLISEELCHAPREGDLMC